MNSCYISRLMLGQLNNSFLPAILAKKGGKTILHFYIAKMINGKAKDNVIFFTVKIKALNNT